MLVIKEAEDGWCVSVSVCCITNHLKLGSLKPHSFMLAFTSLGQLISAGLDWEALLPAASLSGCGSSSQIGLKSDSGSQDKGQLRGEILSHGNDRDAKGRDQPCNHISS